jgi:broad specificity phosphatase PhoE
MISMIELVFETHCTTKDNENGIATGWLPGRLSPAGREQAIDLGRRRNGDKFQAIFSSDLSRAVETVDLAFGDRIPVFLDWRLRECDYGLLNGHPTAALRRFDHLDEPYPAGESFTQAIRRIGRFLDDLAWRWSASRILVVGHTTTRWAFDHFIGGEPLDELIVRDFAWREGWEYRLADRDDPARSI